MTTTIHIAASIRCVVEHLPESVVLPSPGGKTIRQLAREIGVPTALIVFALVNGVKRGLDDRVEGPAQIYLHGTLAGG